MDYSEFKALSVEAKRGLDPLWSRFIYRPISFPTGWFFYKGIGKHFLFIISIFVDFFILDISNMTTIYDSAIGIYLIIYGIFSPLAWGWMVYKIIKNKSTEAFYNKILSKSKIYSK